ncbi:MAG: sterol desaturase family protein [Candidatus Microthrix sp.]|jgi:sterol desaturase/sphingolipid hydroxylase (fatty acid hydroxylase superfamily)|uniref:sterol desaturase family protein n=1 Tax=Candidatus Neomicrothrix parvicella TaxID=41950 RepID=UPI0003815A7D|nr:MULTISPECIES: sterol desaturase family protein [Microthrix]MBK7321889.1 sterol desaturase family protein [Candidatus Microthrix sp.]MBP9064822.1 sterol desaturase family protein [Candidatus Microthrix sp.]
MELVWLKLLLIPIVVGLVGGEGWLAARRRNTHGDVAGWSSSDALTSTGIGAVGQISGGLFRWAMFGVAALLQPFALVHWPDHGVWAGVAQLAAAILVWDMLFYCFHRAAHRTSIGWVSHRAHHESPYFNYGVALRLEWFPVLTVPIFATQALFGFSFGVMAAASIANGLYQGLLHTELVGPLPRYVEAVFNTPTHHRSHHDAELTRGANFGSIFIVWDRLFGTFATLRSAPITYGVTGAVPLHQPLGFLTPLVRPAPRLTGVINGVADALRRAKRAVRVG